MGNKNNLNFDSNKEILKKLKEYESFTKEIEEEIDLLKSENINENIEILEEVITENLGIYSVNESMKDRRGGEVDTIYNVRNGVEYKNFKNEQEYENKEKYDAQKYHGNNKNYVNINKEFSKKKKNGELIDEYSGLKFNRDEKYNLEHVYSSKEIHDDKGRVLAGIDGPTLANIKENLIPISESANKSKKEKTPNEFIEFLNNRKEKRMKRLKELSEKKDLTPKEKKERSKLKKLESVNSELIQKKSKQSKKAIDKKINNAYYFGKKFREDLIKESGKKAGNMAIKTTVSEVMLIGNREFLCYIKEHTTKKDTIFDFLKKLIRGLEITLKKIIFNIKDIIVKIIKSLANGILETIVTTLINIFSTTATTIIKSIRKLINMILNAKKSYSNINNGNNRMRKKEILSLILSGLLLIPLFNGLNITDAVEKAIQSIGIPNTVSDVLSVGITTMLGSGLVFVGARIIEKAVDMVNNNANKLEIMNENMKMQIVMSEAIISQNELQKLSKFTEEYIVKMSIEWKDKIIETENNISEWKKIINKFDKIEIISFHKEKVNYDKITEKQLELKEKLKKIQK